MPMIEVVCARCASPFLVKPFRAKTAKYCSKRCSAQSTSPVKAQAWCRRPSEEIVRDLYETQGLSTGDIAAMHGVSATTAKRWLKHYGIPARPHAFSAKVANQSRPTRSELNRLIHVDHMSLRAIGEQYGVSYTSVTNWCKRYGIPTPEVWDSRSKGERIVLPDADVLRRLYVDEGLSSVEIGGLYRASGSVVLDALHEYGIPVRNGGFDGGKRFVCADGHEVRSTYELRVDDWLHTHGISHVVEPPIPGLPGSRADFLANGWYIEVWGVLGNESYRERRRRKTAHYRAHEIPLIGLTPWMFSRTSGYSWMRRLARVLRHVSLPEPLPRQLELLV